MNPDQFPDLILPQLATLAPAPPEGEAWLHEVKFDGFRLLSSKDGDRVEFYTRNGHRWSDKFPAIAAEVRQLKAERLWLDGEIVVMTGEGRSCFGSLQMAIAEKNQSCLAYYVFDLLFQERNLCLEPLEVRKHMLHDLVHNTWNLYYVDFQRGYGPEFFEAACAQQLEGIVSKKADSIYRPGTRSRTWLKSKYRGFHAVRNVVWKWWQKNEQ